MSTLHLKTQAARHAVYSGCHKYIYIARAHRAAKAARKQRRERAETAAETAADPYNWSLVP